MKEKTDKGGAPTKYKPLYATQAKQLCLLGCTDKELANFFCVTVSTISKWKVENKRFSEALSASKILADGKVAEKLFNRAIGFYYDEVTYEKVSINKVDLEKENIKGDAWKKKVVTKYVIPDVGAQTLWLMNRQKDKWRNKQLDDFDNMPEEVLDEIINRLKSKMK